MSKIIYREAYPDIDDVRAILKVKTNNLMNYGCTLPEALAYADPNSPEQQDDLIQKMESNLFQYSIAKDIEKDEVIAYYQFEENINFNAMSLMGRIAMNAFRLMGYNYPISINELVIKDQHDNYLNIADRFFNDLVYKSTKTGRSVLAVLDIKAISTKVAVDKGFDYMDREYQEGPIEYGYYLRDVNHDFVRDFDAQSASIKHLDNKSPAMSH